MSVTLRICIPGESTVIEHRGLGLRAAHAAALAELQALVVPGLDEAGAASEPYATIRTAADAKAGRVSTLLVLRNGRLVHPHAAVQS